MIKASWMEIKQETFQHCFRKVACTEFSFSMDDTTRNDVQERFGSCSSDALLWDGAVAAELMGDCESFEDFTTTDHDVQAVSDMSDGRITAEMQAASTIDKDFRTIRQKGYLRHVSQRWMHRVTQLHFGTLCRRRCLMHLTQMAQTASSMRLRALRCTGNVLSPATLNKNAF